jgi:hypothetical protein
MDADLSNEVWFFDNLKKMADLMHAKSATRLFDIFRRLTARGMTIVAQHHTNKYRTPEGKLIYKGLGDLRDDFDNLVYLDSALHEDRSRTVSIEPDKVRAVLDRLTFTISPPPDRELAWCDEHVDVAEMVEKVKQRKKDQIVIEVITESRIVEECRERGYTPKTVRAVLSRYIGDLWDCEQMRERNAKVFTLGPG